MRFPVGGPPAYIGLPTRSFREKNNVFPASETSVSRLGEPTVQSSPCGFPFGAESVNQPAFPLGIFRAQFPQKLCFV